MRLLADRRLYLGLAVSVGALLLLAGNVELREAWRLVRGVRLAALVPALALSLTVFGLRAWRWWEIFPKSQRPGFWEVLKALLAGNVLNNFLPGRAGDLARCVLTETSPTARGASIALATMVVEKLADLVALGLVVLVTLHSLRLPPVLQGLFLGVAVLGSLTAAAMVGLVGGPRSIRRLGRLLRSHPRVRQAATGLAAGFLRGLRGMSPARALVVILLTAVLWWLEVLLIQVLAGSLGLSLGAVAGLAAIAIIGLGMMIPAAPGYLGTYELFAVTALGLFGVGRETGTALALLMHSWVLLTTTACGVPALLLAPSGLRRDGAPRPEPSPPTTGREALET